MRLVVLVPLVTSVDLVEVSGLARSVLVLPGVRRLGHLDFDVEELLLLVETLSDSGLVDLLVLGVLSRCSSDGRRRRNDWRRSRSCDEASLDDRPTLRVLQNDTG